MLDFTIYRADVVGSSGNCLYPNKFIVSDKDSLIDAITMDHVTAKYKGNYRSKDNFEFSDCIPLDCDNDHSDKPEDWITPEILDDGKLADVSFVTVPSRHNMLPKDGKSADLDSIYLQKSVNARTRNYIAASKKQSRNSLISSMIMQWMRLASCLVLMSLQKMCIGMMAG